MIKNAPIQMQTFFFCINRFVPAFARLVSWNICLWISFEQLKKMVYGPVSDDRRNWDNNQILVSLFDTLCTFAITILLLLDLNHTL